ncbi:Outer-membrane-phospholipid-binding lipoprotein MlaA [hydrothermal vent metagenome]|uniref:Outer-membrane-phospholipid-binding lipoprotein MlaA n=1 Tax=hydrothermal vent metagenome TaxID=652676 RepID=A0A3B0SCT6_9ZZZZ
MVLFDKGYRLLLQRIVFFGLLFPVLILSACATAPTDTDPLAGYNHSMFDANLNIDQAAFEPVAKGYRNRVAEGPRNGLHNVLNNVRAPTDFMNNVLQANPNGAATTFVRFTINSTLGLAGLFDPASNMGIPSYQEDFGQTLAVWGAGPGAYLVLPFLGPSNVRDTTGLVVDVLTHPFALISYEGAFIVQATNFSANSLDQRTRAIDLIEGLRENSVDEYAAYRSLYEQSRNNAIHNGALDVDDLPDFDEFDDEEYQ